MELLKSLISESNGISSTRFAFLFIKILFSLVISFCMIWVTVCYKPDWYPFAIAILAIIGTGLGLEAWTKTKQKELEIKSGDTNGQN